MSPALAQRAEWQWSWQSAYDRASDAYRGGDLAAALTAARAALDLVERSAPDRHDSIAMSLNLTGVVLDRLGRTREAEPLLRRALELRANAGDAYKRPLAESLNNLGVVSLRLGRIEAAEALHKRALAIRDSPWPESRQELAQSLNNLASVFLAAGQPDKAGPLLNRAVGLISTADDRHASLPLRHAALPDFGEADPDAGDDAFLNVGKTGAAIRSGPAALPRGLAQPGSPRPGSRSPPASPPADTPGPGDAGHLPGGREPPGAMPGGPGSHDANRQRIGPSHEADLAVTLLNLGMAAQTAYRGPRRDEAAALYERALEIQLRALGAEHPDVAITLNNLAELRSIQGLLADSERLHKKALSIREAALGARHPLVAASLTNLARLLSSTQRAREAMPLLERAVGIGEEVLGPAHPDVALAVRSLAIAATAAGEHGRALAAHARATDAVLRHAETMRAISLGSAPSSGARDNRGQTDHHFQSHIAALYAAWRAGQVSEREARERSFVLAQHAGQGAAAGAFGQLSVRLGQGSGELARFVRELQDLNSAWASIDNQLVAEFGMGSSQHAERTGALRRELTAIEEKLARAYARRASDFPDLSELAGPEPLTIEATQALLRNNEALLLFQLGGFGSYVWLVSPEEALWRRLAIGRAGISRLVEALRCGLDGGAWSGRGGQRCRELLRVDFSSDDVAQGKPLPFDPSRAFELYTTLLGELAPALQGRKLLIVASGPLARLPFGVLVDAAPGAASDGAGVDYGGVSWLIRSHAVATLPAVPSLRAVRKKIRPSRAAKPILGIANPLLQGDQRHPTSSAHVKTKAELARAYRTCADVPSATAAAVGPAGVAPTSGPSGLADLAHLTVQSPLPETAIEVCAVASHVGGDMDEMRLGARASEADIKLLGSRDGPDGLAGYRIIHFATHGTLSGEIAGTTEPGLILSPPQTPSEHDDGYLSNSEIAALKLDADLVVLSACNTAGGAGIGLGEPLSGLARSFIYAGARALLVSHWYVDSHAAVKIITGMFSQLAGRTGINRPEALRQAMLDATEDPTRPAGWVSAAHPSIWGPFVVVGDGS